MPYADIAQQLQASAVTWDDIPWIREAWHGPLVIKGVIAARENRFNDAIDLWKKAKAVEPAYPNIDQLIAEAEKRRK